MNFHLIKNKNWGGEESGPHLLKDGTKTTIYKY
jgi:hypothetical protein